MLSLLYGQALTSVHIVVTFIIINACVVQFFFKFFIFSANLPLLLSVKGFFTLWSRNRWITFSCNIKGKEAPRLMVPFRSDLAGVTHLSLHMQLPLNISWHFSPPAYITLLGRISGSHFLHLSLPSAHVIFATPSIHHWWWWWLFSSWVMSNSLQCMDWRTPGSSFLLEFAQVHVHWVSDAI